MSRFALPGPLPLTEQEHAALAGMVERIYWHCRGNRGARVGRPYMSWRMDLTRRSFALRASPAAKPEKLLRWTYTPHMNDQREMVAADFEFTFADRAERYFVAQPVNFKGLHLYLGGDEFERTFPIEMSAPVTEDQWDVWGQGLSAPICEHYERVVYPRVVETVRAIADGRPLRVVDLGGGNGRLAEMIAAEVAQARVLVVDRSAALIAQAGARAAKNPERLTARCADVTADGLVESLEPPDVYVLCGVVAQQVLEREQALALVRACHGRLRAGGFVLVPSYSPALLTSDDYAAIGFTVHNRTLSVLEDEGGKQALRTNDFYVLEKT